MVESIFSGNNFNVISEFELLRGVKINDKIIRNIVMRSMNGYDEDLLASRSISNYAKFNKLLTNCTESIGDITDKGVISDIISNKLSSNDRLYMIFCLRRVSVGDEFIFSTICPQCNKEINLVVDLSKLNVLRVKDEDYFESKEFDIYGHKFQIRVVTGKVEEAYLQMNIKDDIPSYNIFIRTEFIDGKNVSIEDIKKLPLKIRNKLREIFDKSEGKLDTNVLAKCSDSMCGWTGSVDIDISDRNFFFPQGE